MSGDTKNTPTHISDESILRSILGANQIAHIERIARGDRMRELLASLGDAAKRMQHDERVHFAELIQLAQQEHIAAGQAQDVDQQIASLRELLSAAMENAKEITAINEKMRDVYTSMRNLEASQPSAEPVQPSPWKRLLNMHKNLQRED